MKTTSPSGRLVLFALALNVAVGVLMVFGTLAHLTELADGLEPFDLRPRGYSIGEARMLIAMLGEEGRRYYVGVHQWAANIYPATFLLSRGLVLWWLTENGRISDRPLPLTWRYALLFLPIAEVVPDYLENIRILDMLAAGPDRLRPELVAAASMATQAKIVLTGLTELAVLVTGTIAFARWLKRRSA